MSNTLAYIEVSQLPEYTSQGKFLQFQIENWRKQLSEAGSLMEQAWKMYQDAVDDKKPRAEIMSLYDHACLFNDISDEAWRELESAKAEYLLLLN